MIFALNNFLTSFSTKRKNMRFILLNFYVKRFLSRSYGNSMLYDGGIILFQIHIAPSKHINVFLHQFCTFLFFFLLMAHIVIVGKTTRHSTEGENPVRRSQAILHKDGPILELFGIDNPYKYKASICTMLSDPNRYFLYMWNIWEVWNNSKLAY